MSQFRVLKNVPDFEAEAAKLLQDVKERQQLLAQHREQQQKSSLNNLPELKNVAAASHPPPRKKGQAVSANYPGWFELTNENFQILNAVSLESRVYFNSETLTFYERRPDNKGVKLFSLNSF